MPRMVGEKSSATPLLIGLVVLALVGAAAYYALRGGSQDDNANTDASSANVAGMGNRTSDAMSSDSNAGSDNTASGDNATSGDNSAMSGNTSSDSAMSGNSADGNSVSDGAMSGSNSMSSGNATSGSEAANTMSGNSLPVPFPSPRTSSSSGSSSQEKATRSKTIVKPDGSKVTYSKSVGDAEKKTATGTR